jgi:hypothetical protein
MKSMTQRTMTKVARSGWWLPLGAVATLGACDDASAPAGATQLTVGQLSARLEAGVERLEVTWDRNGVVREIELEDEGPGHAAEWSGRVVAVDRAAQTLTLAHIGTVDLAGVTRFRGEDGADVDADTWYAALEAAVAAGTAAIDARGALGETAFIAQEIRVEDDMRTQIEVDFDASALDTEAGVLRIGWLVVPFGDATLQTDDGDDDDDDGIDDDDDGDDDGDDDEDDTDDDDDATDDDDDATDDDDDATDDDDDATDDDDDATDDTP